MSEPDHELDHDLDAGLDPEPGPDHEHEHGGHEAEPGHARKKKASRFPFAHRSPAGAAKWKRETRFGVAALLSFVILVTVLLINKQRGQAKEDTKEHRRNRPHVLALASNSPSEESSKPAPETDQKPAQASDTPPPPSPLPSPPSLDGKPVPELPETESSSPPLPDDKLRGVGNENESVPLPAPVPGKVGPGAGAESIVPPPATTGAPDPPLPEQPKGTDPGLPPPAAPEGPPPMGEPNGDASAPPEPTPTPTPGPDSAMPPPQPGEPGSTSPPAAGSGDLAAPAELAGPAEPQAAGGPNEIAIPPPQPTEMKPDQASPGAAPGTETGSAPGHVGEPPPMPDPKDPSLPAAAPPLTEAPSKPDQASPGAEPGTETGPASGQVGEPTPMPNPPDPSVPAAVEAPPLTEAPSLVETPPQPQTQTQAPPSPQLQDQASPAVGPGEVPNFDRAPATEESKVSSSAPPEIQPGQGIPIPNAGRGRSLEDDVPAKVASDAVSAGVSTAASAVAKGRLAPEIHVVERGENFWTISRHYYNSGRYYMALWKANSRTVSAPAKLMVGQTIVIPPPEALDRNMIEPPRVSAGASSSSSSSPAGAPVRRTSRSQPDEDDSADKSVRRSSEVELILPIENATLDGHRRSRMQEELDPPPEKRYRASRPRYKVRAGETLRTIARDMLNESRRADEIYELNRDILDDRHNPVEGQILELPDDARSGLESQ